MTLEEALNAGRGTKRYAMADYRDRPSGDGYKFFAAKLNGRFYLDAALYRNWEVICCHTIERHKDLAAALDFVDWRPLYVS